VKTQLKGKTETRSAIAASKPSGVGESKQWQSYVVPSWKHKAQLMWIENIPVCTPAVVPWTQRQPVFPEVQGHIVAMMPFTAGGQKKIWLISRCFLYLPGSNYVLCTSSKGHFYIKKIL